MNSKEFEGDSSSHEPDANISILEKFVRQLTDLTRYAKEEKQGEQTQLHKTVSDVQSTADDILHHFALLKAEISQEVAPHLRSTVYETLDSAIADTVSMKNALSIFEEKDPSSLLAGDWAEQIARWVHLYSRWKNKREVARQVMKNLAKRVDQLIEKDLQFIEEYQKQSLAHLKNDPFILEDLKDRFHYQLNESLQKLRALRNRPENLSLEKASEWNEKIHKKRSSYLDSVLHKIESIIEEEAPFVHEPTDISASSDLENEYRFLEKEIDHVLALLPRIDRENSEEKAFIESRLNELRGYAEELLESALKSPALSQRLRSLLERFPTFS